MQWQVPRHNFTKISLQQTVSIYLGRLVLVSAMTRCDFKPEFREQPSQTHPAGYAGEEETGFFFGNLRA